MARKHNACSLSNIHLFAVCEQRTARLIKDIQRARCENSRAETERLSNLLGAQHYPAKITAHCRRGFATITRGMSLNATVSSCNASETKSGTSQP
jgi:hypothetical protein